MENQTQRSLIRNAASFAFNGVFDHALPWLVVWLSVIGFALLGLMGCGLLVSLGYYLTYGLSMSGAYFFGSIAGAVLFVMFYMPSLHLGLTRTLLIFRATGQITFQPYFKLNAIIALAVSYMFLSILIALGLALFIIPGVIVIVRTMFTTYFIVDRNLGPLAAIQASWNLTRGKYNITLGLAGICLLMNMLPFIGWLMTGLMTVYAYEALSKPEMM